MPKINLSLIEDADDLDQFESIPNGRKLHESPRSWSPPEHRTQMEEFKCGHCKTFVGPPISGGRHRNHCPLCLYSRHVDRKHPGDRLSNCRSLMAPKGTYFRRNGEQVIVHSCLGCGEERHCRAAADDSTVTCMRLDVLDSPIANQDQFDKEEVQQTAQAG